MLPDCSGGSFPLPQAAMENTNDSANIKAMVFLRKTDPSDFI